MSLGGSDPPLGMMLHVLGGVRPPPGMMQHVRGGVRPPPKVMQWAQMHPPRGSDVRLLQVLREDLLLQRPRGRPRRRRLASK